MEFVANWLSIGLVNYETYKTDQTEHFAIQNVSLMYLFMPGQNVKSRDVALTYSCVVVCAIMLPMLRDLIVKETLKDRPCKQRSVTGFF